MWLHKNSKDKCDFLNWTFKWFAGIFVINYSIKILAEKLKLKSGDVVWSRPARVNNERWDEKQEREGNKMRKQDGLERKDEAELRS